MSENVFDNAFALFEEAEVITPSNNFEENAIASEEITQAQNGFDSQALEAFWNATASSSLDDIFGAVPPATEEVIPAAEANPTEFHPPLDDFVRYDIS
ncbi:MAG: hypothetical protein HC820_08745 [Hydrococcus sp. RM1_1_31]|nr:hypothetical protein [Hydrococcus sp. RM1_1_31]